MKISIELPFFPGFYESDLENSDTSYWAIKEELEYYTTDCVEEHPEYAKLTEDDLDFDYRGYEKELIDGFVEGFRSYAPDFVESVEFDEMVSPKYYNYSTDRIFAYVELADDWKDKVRAFMSENYEWLKDRIKKDWTSYDGFTSFMENDIREWDKMLFEEEDARYISTMIGYIMYRGNKNIREDLVMFAREDVYEGSFVFIIPEVAERLKQEYDEGVANGTIKVPDPDQMELPFTE